MGNPVVHFEIAGPDGAALQQYYGELFGWQIFETEGAGGETYRLVNANEGGIGGGIFTTREDMPVRNFVTFYVQVDELQAALDSIAGAGGAPCMPPMEIGEGMGAIAAFNDPAGNFIGLYSLPEGWDGEMPPKGDAPPVVHFEIGGKDAKGLQGFYESMFGWEFHFYEAMKYRIIQRDAEGIGIGGGMFEHTPEMPPNAPSLGVQVDDLQAYLDKAVELGGTAMMQPMEVPGGGLSIAIFYDIVGNRITLVKPSGDHVHPHE